MAIFNRIEKEPEVNDEILACDALATTEALDNILLDSARDIYQISAGLYIADLICEEAILEGTATPEVLLESLAEDTIKRFIDIVKKLAARVMAFFKSAILFLQKFFLHGEKYIKLVRAEVLEKRATGFKYSSYHYSCEKGDELVKKIVNEVALNDSNLSNIKLSEEKPSVTETGSVEERKTEILKKIGIENISELGNEIAKEYRGSAEKQEISDFENMARGNMMNFITSNGGVIKDLNEKKGALDKAFNEMLGELNKLKTGFKKEEKSEARSKALTEISKAVKIFDFCTVLATKAVDIKIKMYREMATEYEKTIRKYLAFKPAKAAVAAKENTTTSIFEQAMKLV
jgi:hypothetical protein